MILIRLIKKLNTLFGPIEKGSELRVPEHYADKLLDAGWATRAPSVVDTIRASVETTAGTPCESTVDVGLDPEPEE